MNFGPWLHKSTKSVRGGSIWWFSGFDSRIRQNHLQEVRFDNFLALAPEVDKTSPRRLDFEIFRLWFQKLTKPVPGGTIWWLFGLGSRARNLLETKFQNRFPCSSGNWPETCWKPVSKTGFLSFLGRGNQFAKQVSLQLAPDQRERKKHVFYISSYFKLI